MIKISFYVIDAKLEGSLHVAVFRCKVRKLGVINCIQDRTSMSRWHIRHQIAGVVWISQFTALLSLCVEYIKIFWVSTSQASQPATLDINGKEKSVLLFIRWRVRVRVRVRQESDKSRYKDISKIRVTECNFRRLCALIRNVSLKDYSFLFPWAIHSNIQNNKISVIIKIIFHNIALFKIGYCC